VNSRFTSSRSQYRVEQSPPIQRRSARSRPLQHVLLREVGPRVGRQDHPILPGLLLAALGLEPVIVAEPEPEVLVLLPVFLPERPPQEGLERDVQVAGQLQAAPVGLPVPDVGGVEEEPRLGPEVVEQVELGPELRGVDGARPAGQRRHGAQEKAGARERGGRAPGEW